MPDKKLPLTNMALCSVFGVLAAITGILEGILGFDAFLPGVRFGFANIFIMAAFVLYGTRFALSVMLLRIGLVFLFTGNVTALLLSFCGGICAFAGLCLFMPLYGRKCTLIGISAFSSALHGIGQLTAAFFLTNAPVFWYLPLLCTLSACTGILNGFLLDRLLPLFPENIRKKARFPLLYTSESIPKSRKGT